MKLAEPKYYRTLTATGLTCAAFLLVFGSFKNYDISPMPAPAAAPVIRMLDTADGPSAPLSIPDLNAAPQPSPPQISPVVNDWDMVVNTTFTGITRTNGYLQFTYNPATKKGKQSCPT